LKVVKIPGAAFNQIEKYMPFPSVDIVILQGRKIILTKRTIRPYRGYWSLPGSVILKNEKMVDAVKRSAKQELGIEVANPTFVGNYETFTKFRHYITHLFTSRHKTGRIQLDFQSFRVILVVPNRIPNHTVPIQKLMIREALKKIR